MLSIVGCEISVLFKDYPKEKKVEVSIRSSENYDVSKVAQIFGGGGHKVAAGVSISGNFGEVKDRVLKELEKIIIDK